MNLDNLKEMAIVLAYAVPITPDEKFPFICVHPFTNSPVHFPKDGTPCDLTNESEKERWLVELKENIMSTKNFSTLWTMIGDNWKLTYLKYTKNYFSKSEFANYLAEAWVLAENPNADANCSHNTLIKWFRNADKKFLMVKDDYDIWINLPDSLKVYRGVGVSRNKMGLSWTFDKNKAIWFAQRFNYGNQKGYLLEGVIEKKNILAYFNTRGEKEVVADYTKIEFIKKIEV